MGKGKRTIKKKIYNNIYKIKSSSSQELKEELFLLILWFKKCNPNNPIITKIVDKYNSIPPKLSFKILSSEIINIKNKPLYTKFIDDIRLRLAVEVDREDTVLFFINRYGDDFSLLTELIRPHDIKDLEDWYEESLQVPTYSYSIPVMLDAKTIKIDLPCVNGSGVGVIGIGTVDVYVDNHWLLGKRIEIEIAPSEKIEKEIISAEKKLKQINQTSYLENEIRLARNEMTEIEKFKFFRGGSEKQNQIQSQQAKIDKLIQNSKDEKKKNIRTEEEKIYKLKMELSAAKY